MIKDLEQLSDNWPSPFVSRNLIDQFTNGKYKPRTMNTYDGAGKGIKRRIRLKGKIAYLKEDVINWIKERRKK
ncbi:MAG: hypothetical protein IJ730_04810 [Alphaproteobacteria bacterium]|nr:hypothetical protein [Alphaproteobacteria bacterium]MBR2137545.1 hypothetical protein [Alphaproteobacteria bacterium]